MKRTISTAAAFVALSALIAGTGCATHTASGSSPGGTERKENAPRQDKGTDTFSSTTPEIGTHGPFGGASTGNDADQTGTGQGTGGSFRSYTSSTKPGSRGMSGKPQSPM